MATLKSLSIAARVMIDMHALNNEGNESNRLMPRRVGIVTPTIDEQGEAGYLRSTVNAISGDMNKHIFADYLRHIALDQGLPLCDACKALDPARMMANPWFLGPIENKDNDEYWDTVIVGKKKEKLINGTHVVNRLLTCTLDDVCGILITSGPVKRKSAIEFGWTVGLPVITEVEEYIHARHAIHRTTSTRLERDADDATKEAVARERERNIGQMVFNRPVSSGVYAFVAHLDVCAIGFNEYSQEYPSQPYGTQIDRAGRLRAVLLALAQTVLQPKGALTSTQLPHVLEIDGFVSVSTSAAAAPLISPLVDDYTQRAEQVAGLLNQMHGDSVGVLPFSGQDGLLQQIEVVVNNYGPGRYGGR